MERKLDRHALMLLPASALTACAGSTQGTRASAPAALLTNREAPRRRLRQTLAAALVLAALHASQSIASGHIGPIPTGPQKFRSFAKCKAYLQEQYANDVAATKNASAENSNAEPERSLKTDGVVQSSRREARYGVLRSYVSRMVMDDMKTIQSQYSYTESNFVCKGRTLTGTEMQGYHLPTYEPIEQRVKENPAMTTTEANTAANPTLGAAEVGRRFLKLLESLKSRNDITVERVQEVMGLTLKQGPSGPFYSQPLGGDWFYVVSMGHETPPGQRVGASLEFINKADRFADMSSICGLSFEDYHNTLKSFGYLDGFRYDEIGRLSGVDYRRGDFYIGITPEVKGFADGKAYPTCVQRIGLLTPY